MRAVFRQSTAYPALPRVRPEKKVEFAAITEEARGEYPEILAVVFTPATVSPALELPILQTLNVTVAA